MDSKSFNPKMIVTLKTVKDNKEYLKDKKAKLLPTSKEGVPLKDGETEVKIITNKKEAQEVGDVSVIVPKRQLRNVKKVVLLAERPNEREPTIVKEFDTNDIKKVKGKLLRGRNPIKTKAIVIRVTKKNKKRVNLKVNIKICVKTTTTGNGLILN